MLVTGAMRRAELVDISVAADLDGGKASCQAITDLRGGAPLDGVKANKG